MEEAHSELDDESQGAHEEREEEELVDDEAYPADYQQDDFYSYYGGGYSGYSYEADYEPYSYSYEEQEPVHDEGPSAETKEERTPSVAPSTGSGRAGRNGPRSTSHTGDRRSPSGEGGSGRSAKSGDSGRRPRGNLPPAPSFDGDRHKDPKCFRRYALKVDSYVAIAEKIIDESEIGLRLHAALEGPAADFLEDVPAKTFGKEDGWRVLLKILKDKFDESRMTKVGGAMKGFFNLQMPSDKPATMRDVADFMDKQARACRDAGLTLPDPVMIHFFFQHSNASAERQANLLLRTNGEYDWSKMKQAVELLYPNVPVKLGNYDYKPKQFRGRGAHEVQHSDWFQEWPMPDAADQHFGEWLAYYDPVEAVADTFFRDNDTLPESIAVELHSCFASHRENRQKLAQAVQARGFYVKGKGGKGKSKGKAGSKGAGKKGSGKKGGGGGKARGMSLEELKKVTACSECGEIGHWHSECPRKAHATIREEDGDHEEEDDDYYGEWTPEEWDAWNYEHFGSQHAANVSQRRLQPPDLQRRNSMTDEAYDVAYNLRNLRNKVLAKKREAPSPSSSPARPMSSGGAKPKASPPRSTAQAVRSDDFVDPHEVDFVRKIMATAKSDDLVTMSASSGPAAVRAAHRELDMTYEEPGSVWRLLATKDDPAPDVDSLRVRQAYTARKVEILFQPDNEDELIPDYQVRLSYSLSRRQPTVVPGRSYLTIDTACENTVCGSAYLQHILDNLKAVGLMPLQQAEHEQYCFGPGKPQTSTTRLSVPIGIGGRAAIIRTSLISEETLTGGQGPNGIPLPRGTGLAADDASRHRHRQERDPASFAGRRGCHQGGLLRPPGHRHRRVSSRRLASRPHHQGGSVSWCGLSHLHPPARRRRGRARQSRPAKGAWHRAGHLPQLCLRAQSRHHEHWHTTGTMSCSTRPLGVSA